MITLSPVAPTFLPFSNFVSPVSTMLSPVDSRRICHADKSVKGAWRHFVDEYKRATNSGDPMHAEWANAAHTELLLEHGKLFEFVAHHGLQIHWFGILSDIENGLVARPLLPEAVALARLRPVYDRT